MGGLIVQKYLELHDAPAGVLMATIPPQGNLGNALRWITRHPWHFTKMTITGKALPFISTPLLARKKFFSGIRRTRSFWIARHGCKRTARASASTAWCSACPGLNG
jgi:hypothetical protein